MAAAAPSTAPANPLEESLAKIMGANALSEGTGTSPLSYDQLGFRQPQADVINISGSPGTGATTAETWSHDIALENLRREQLQFEYEQRQNEVANVLRQQEAERAAAESARQEAQLGLTRQTTAQQLATAQQAMGSEAQRQAQTAQAMKYATTGEQRQAQQAALDAQVKAQQMAIARANEERQAIESFYKYGGMSLAERERQSADAAARYGWQLQAQQSVGPIGATPKVPSAPRIGTASNQAYTQATGYTGAQLGPYNQPRLVVPYATNPGSAGSAGPQGYVDAQGYYTPSGTGPTRYLGTPGTAIFNSNMQAMNPANVGKPSYMWV